MMRAVNDKFLIGVTGVIFNNKHEVLLVKHSYRRVAWSLPGGYLQGKEHPKEGLEREVFEETNFKVLIEKIIKTRHDDTSARLDMCYVGTYLKGDFKKSSEVIDYGFFPLNKLPSIIDDQYEQIELANKRYRSMHGKNILSQISNLFIKRDTK
jgi:ADP-ribose pyrophosphatase YjhB (NUDIX family)